MNKGWEAGHMCQWFDMTVLGTEVGQNLACSAPKSSVFRCYASRFQQHRGAGCVCVEIYAEKYAEARVLSAGLERRHHILYIINILYISLTNPFHVLCILHQDILVDILDHRDSRVAALDSEWKNTCSPLEASQFALPFPRKCIWLDSSWCKSNFSSFHMLCM